MALKQLYLASVLKHDIWQQVAGACMVASRDIKNEDPGTTNHTDRLIWAASVDENAKSMAVSMLVDVLSNTTIAADVDGATDTDVQFVVNSLIDTYAG